MKNAKTVPGPPSEKVKFYPAGSLATLEMYTAEQILSCRPSEFPELLDKFVPLADMPTVFSAKGNIQVTKRNPAKAFEIPFDPIRSIMSDPTAEGDLTDTDSESSGTMTNTCPPSAEVGLIRAVKLAFNPHGEKSGITNGLVTVTNFYYSKFAFNASDTESASTFAAGTTGDNTTQTFKVKCPLEYGEIIYFVANRPDNLCVPSISLTREAVPSANGVGSTLAPLNVLSNIGSTSLWEMTSFWLANGQQYNFEAYLQMLCNVYKQIR